MEIDKLNNLEIGKLNELQKYFYDQMSSFIQELDVQYIDANKTFFKVKRIKSRYALELKITSKKLSEIDIDICVEPKEAIIYLNGWHEEIPYEGDSFAEFYGKLKRLLVFSLSENCKIIIYKSNNKPYKWSLYAFEENKWNLYSYTSLLIYNFFGRRTWEEKQSHIFKEAIYPKELFAPK